MAKLKKLELNVSDLQKYRETETILFAKCGITGNEIRLTFSGGIEIWNNGVKLHSQIQPYWIIEQFNKLQSEFDEQTY